MAGRNKWMAGAPDGRAVAALLLAAVFAVSSGAGCVAAGQIGDPDARLSGYLSGYLALAAEGALAPSVWGVLWHGVRFAVVAIVLGSTALGVIGIPVLVAFRGFALCYAVSACYGLFGADGLVLALILFGFSGFLWLPVLLELCVRGLSGAWGLLRRATGNGRCPVGVSGGGPIGYGACAVALLGQVCIEYFLVPTLLQQIAGSILSG